MSSPSNLITVLCILLTICGAIQNSSPIAKSPKPLKKTIFLTRATVRTVDGDGATKHVEFGVGGTEDLGFEYGQQQLGSRVPLAVICMLSPDVIRMKGEKCLVG